MRKHLILINLVVIVAAVLLWVKYRSDYDTWEQQHRVEDFLSRIKTPPASPVEVPKAVVPVVKVVPTDLTYIGENNVFHRDRNMLPPPPKPSQAPPPPPPPPKLTNPPVVLGVMEIDGQKSVMVQPSKQQAQQPQQPGAGGRSAQMLKVGDYWDTNWLLEKIGEDRIVLVNGPTREEVLVDDPRRAKTAVPQTSRGPVSRSSSVVTIGGGSAPASAARTAAISPASQPQGSGNATFTPATPQTPPQPQPEQPNTRMEAIRNLFRSRSNPQDTQPRR